jgi:hypothetical protein
MESQSTAHAAMSMLPKPTKTMALTVALWKTGGAGEFRLLLALRLLHRLTDVSQSCGEAQDSVMQYYVPGTKSAARYPDVDHRRDYP